MAKQKRIIFFGAHPDDCELRFGGTALRLTQAGHVVKFVSCCNGDKGHQSMTSEGLAARRYAEAQKSKEIAGLAEYQILDIPDCELVASLENRHRIIRIIRAFKPDVIISHRTCDYHADHRAAGQLVQDAAYLVKVPLCCPDTPIPDENPVFACCYDGFTDPRPFRADAVIPIDDVLEKKLQMMDCHVSQFYEWLPWDKGYKDFDVNKIDKRKWLMDNWIVPRNGKIAKTAGISAQYAEAFELTPYGRQVSLEEFSALLNP